jgi:hypothetical protein
MENNMSYYIAGLIVLAAALWLIRRVIRPATPCCQTDCESCHMSPQGAPQDSTSITSTCPEKHAN